ncbi:MAG: hypothetical protein GX020_06015 [Firmicutes bacterium]|nr:hypothetical protein [Bacillota bacterium]
MTKYLSKAVDIGREGIVHLVVYLGLSAFLSWVGVENLWLRWLAIGLNQVALYFLMWLYSEKR